MPTIGPAVAVHSGEPRFVKPQESSRNFELINLRLYEMFEPSADANPISDDMQDGMLSYYLSQVGQTDWYTDRETEHTPFDFRDFMSPPASQR